MTSYLYYLPGQADNIDPREGKLSYAFEDKPMGRRVVDRGPDGGSGAIFVDAGMELSQLGHFPDRQRWTDVPFLGCWIGYYPDNPPRPEELQRKRILDGLSVEIADQFWTIPVARSFEEIDGNPTYVNRLSQYIQVNYETGEWQMGEIRECYRPLWDAAMKYWDHWSQLNLSIEEEQNGESPELQHAEVLDMAVLAIQTNYRIEKAEVSIGGMMTPESCREIMEAVIDLASLDAVLKKNIHSAAGGSSIGSGTRIETDSTTPQPSLT